MSKKGFMKTKISRFDCLVARYYPAAYSFAARLTDDPREAVALTQHAFNSARKQPENLRNQTAIATVLFSAVLLIYRRALHGILRDERTASNQKSRFAFDCVDGEAAPEKVKQMKLRCAACTQEYPTSNSASRKSKPTSFGRSCDSINDGS